MAAFDDFKEAIMALIRAKGCKDYNYIDSKFRAYADGLELLFEFVKTFDYDPAHLTALLACIDDDTILQDNGVYFNISVDDPVYNPRMIVNCQFNEVYVSGAENIHYKKGLEIFTTSTINKLIVNGSVHLESLVIGPGCVVRDLDVAEGSTIDQMLINIFNGTAGELQKLSRNSTINNLSIQEGANFGGYYIKGPEISYL